MNTLTRHEVQMGVALRLVRDYLSVPAGTLGIVEIVTSGRHWHFTVRWKPHIPIAGPSGPQQRIMPMERSLNLSEEDLKLFEIATDQDLLSPRHPSDIPLRDGLNAQDEQQLGFAFPEEP